MEYRVFTDGAHSSAKSKISAAFVILTSEDFITAKSYVFDGMQSNSAETIAIGSAAEYLLNNVEFTEKDSVTFITDSKNAMDYLTKARSLGGIKAYDKVIQFATSKFVELCNIGCTVEIKKVKGHLEGAGVNKYADRLAKHALRAALAGE